MNRKFTALLALLLAVLITACGAQQEDHDNTEAPEDMPQEPFTLTVRISEAQETLDPARVTAQGGDAILYHLFENLMRWEDDGSGWTAVACGQAESYTVDTDYAGNSTYTFKLRDGIAWSDGSDVTADDFVNAWRRLADPANELPYRYLLEAVTGYDEVQETGETSLLGVSAPDKRTFVVSLQGSPSYFLEEVCASAYTMPVYPGADSNDKGAVTNGAYTAAGVTKDLVTLERSETYYDRERQGPETIYFQTITGSQADYDALAAGDVSLVVNLPAEPLQALADSGLWTPEPVTETYGILLNTQKEPFDDPDVRLAFHLAVDRPAIVELLGALTARPAPGIVPYGVADYSERPVEEAAEEPEAPVLPDPNAVPAPEPEEPAPTCWDFRSHSLQVVTVEHAHDYETDHSYAQTLMAQAGYPNGSGFPEVEYIYVNRSAADRALAEALQAMWKDCLGVTITLRDVSEAEYLAALAPAEPVESEESGESEGSAETADSAESPESGGENASVPAFTMAAQAFTAPYSDAGALLELWHSESPSNVTGYASDAFDILLNSARAAVSPDARDAYLHDAEAILLEDSPVIPVLCRGGSFQLAEGLTGLYRGPNGVYFLQNIVASEE